MRKRRLPLSLISPQYLRHYTYSAVGNDREGLIIDALEQGQDHLFKMSTRGNYVFTCSTIYARITNKLRRAFEKRYGKKLSGVKIVMRGKFATGDDPAGLKLEVRGQFARPSK